MVNRGQTPIDGNSATGNLRLTVGDTSSVPLDPEEPGWADYSAFSDAVLDAALSNSGGNVMRAAGNLYLQLAVEYTITGRSIRTDDLALDTRGRGKDLRDIAQFFFDSATAAEIAESNDFFQIVPFSGRSGACCRAEGTPWPCDCGAC